MSILANCGTRVIVQGITGSQGRFHTARMLEYGTRIAAGVTPGKGGQTEQGVPVFNTVREAKEATGADASVIFVPAPFAAASILEAAEAGLRFIVCITEGIPVLDMVRVRRSLEGRKVTLLGPNCPGLISVGECKIGIMPAEICRRGRIGVISRSGTLTYESVSQLSALGLGQSTALGVGGDPVKCFGFTDALRLFQQDIDTVGVLMIGEIGGSDEEDAAALVRTGGFTKPLAAFIAGSTAPKGKRMGHAGAIISGGSGTAAGKIAALSAAGVTVAPTPDRMGAAMQEALDRAGLLQSCLSR